MPMILKLALQDHQDIMFVASSNLQSVEWAPREVSIALWHRVLQQASQQGSENLLHIGSDDDHVPARNSFAYLSPPYKNLKK